MEERREYQRIYVSFPVECKLLPERKKIFYTVSKDISRGGARIISEEFLKKGEDIKISINLISEITEAKAQVVWCNKEPYTDRYYVGLKFLELNERSRRSLHMFLSKIKNTEQQ